MERKGEKKEQMKIVKLNFIVWFDIKFGKEMNYNFFLWTNLSFILNTKLFILVIKYNLILIPNLFYFKKF